MNSPSTVKPICGLCRSANRPLICEHCANKELNEFTDGFKWKTLLSERTSLELHLQDILTEKRELYEQQQLWLYFSKARKELQKKRAEMTKRLRSIRQETEKLYSSNQSRVKSLMNELNAFSKSVAQFKRLRTIDDHSSKTFLTVCESWYSEITQREVRLLVNSIELKRVNGEVQIMGIPYRQTEPNSSSDISEDLGAAIGYALWLIGRLGFYCNVPLLHMGRYECSTSHVMKPERIFNHHQRYAHWIKYQLSIPSTDSETKSRIEAWNEVAQGVVLIQRSLKSIASSLNLDTQNLSCFDLLYLIVEKLMSGENARRANEDVGSCSYVDNRSEQSSEVNDDWCEIAPLVLPPPPWADADIAQYESALIKREETTSTWKSLYQYPVTYFQSLFMNRGGGGLRTHKMSGFGEIPNTEAVPLTLLVVSLAVRVLINVSIALQCATPSSVESRVQRTNSIQQQNEQKTLPKRPKSVQSRPLLFQKKTKKSNKGSEFEDDASSVSSDSFTFMSLQSPTPDLSLHDGNDDDDDKLITDFKAISHTQNRSVSPFANAVLNELEKDQTSFDPPVSSQESLEFNAGNMEELETSVFGKVTHELSLRLPEVLELTEDEQDVKKSIQETKDYNMNEPSTNHGDKVELKLIEDKTKEEEDSETMEMHCVSPCSSLRSTFSDSIAAKFVNSNFSNPQYFEDDPEPVSRTPMNGSIRHRYTMRRIQSMLSRRSTLSPSVDGRTTPHRIPRSPSILSRRSLATSLSRRLSFRSRDENAPKLSEAYSVIRLETCIRKAWHMSMNHESLDDAVSVDKRSKPMRSELKSIKKKLSRKPDHRPEVSFVHVPLDPSDRLLAANQAEAVLNPYFGDDTQFDEEMSSSDDGNTLDGNSLILRTPMQRIAPIDENYTRCEKNLDEGLYDNPLELCSFRSYDSDTELELTSFRFRNPISKLLELDRVRGVSKDGIALSELEGNEYGSAMLKEVGKCPVRDSMLDKYLTQLAINNAIESSDQKEGEGTGEDTDKWTTCHEEWVPQELDSGLRCFLLERFLLDNVSHEMDVNLEAMELARVQQRRPPSGSRKLRRS
eukprot:g2701.t1